MAIVPHTEESLWEMRDNFRADASASNYWVGAPPRLATPDAAVSYAHTSDTEEPFTFIGAAARLVPFTWPDPDGVRITAQIRLTGSVDGYGGVVLGFVSEGSGPGWPVLNIDRTGIWDQVEVDATGEWVIISVTLAPFSSSTWQPEAKAAAAAGALWVYATVNPSADEVLQVSWLQVETLGSVEGVLAIDTHDHPWHLIGTRELAMPYELVIDTGLQRLVEIVAGEEALATYELVFDETGRAGTPWSHCGLFRPL